MIDTHAHLHDPAFDPDRDEAIERARAAGVEHVVAIGCDLSDSLRAMQLAERTRFGWTLGVHPHEAIDAPQDLGGAFDRAIAAATVQPLAIGETGLDFYYDHSPRDVQVSVFEKQIAYARDAGLPLVFHQRDAFETFVETLRAHRFEGMRGVVHCFTGTAEQARVLVDEFGFYLGIGGVVTFKNAEPLREAVRTVGIERIVLETDAPYLAPVPRRGSRNEPAFLPLTAARLSEVLACGPDEVAAATTRNARELFGL